MPILEVIQEMESSVYRSRYSPALGLVDIRTTTRVHEVDRNQYSYEINSCIDREDRNILNTGNERVYILFGKV